MDNSTDYIDLTDYFKTGAPGGFYTNDKRDVFVLVRDKDGHHQNLLSLRNGEIKHWSKLDMTGIKAVYPNEIMW